MLSVLIPVFNVDVTQLVTELHRQALACNAEFEILAYDDCSAEHYKKINRNITLFKHVQYVELQHNIGRSAIRNMLAEHAHYNYLLFLDCDSEITSENFLRKYFGSASPETVLFGGRSYASSPPADKNKLLRWHYGTKRECIPVKIRQKKPYKYFMTNNFMIPKKVFSGTRFNENLKGYGYEDTLFACDLKRNKINILHINNYLCHIGLEDATVFLGKTRQAISNLAWLIRNNLADKDVKLLKYYDVAKQLHLATIIRFLSLHFQKKITDKLMSGTPDLYLFDFLKLAWLTEEMGA